MKDFLLVMIPVIVAAVSMPLFDGFTKAVGFLDKLPAWGKQIAVAALTFGATKLAILLGVQMTIVDATTLTQQDVAALFSAGLTYIFKLGKTQKEIRANQT